METHTVEWLSLLARWVHIIAAIMWIGNSMLYNWMDRNLRPGRDHNETKFGELWMLHGGGFYRLEKFRAQASTVPPLLFWFKWQSYTTWISGFALLILVYFQSRGAFLLNPANGLSYGEGVATALAFLATGWLVYDILWRIPSKGSGIKIVISLILLVFATKFATDTFSGRGAYLMVGALLATLMSGNVFFHIMVSQRKMMADIESGHDQDMALYTRAKTRSIHNNYITFPVIFTMMSNHFANLYGHPLNWVILLILVFMSALIRHFMNIRFNWKPWFAACTATFVIAGILLYFVFSFGSKPAHANPAAAVSTDGPPVTFAEARTIIENRCLPCHSVTPSTADPMYAALATTTGGVHFDTPEQIKSYAERIKIRAIDQDTMPLGNMTGMTADERATLARWLAAGANIN